MLVCEGLLNLFGTSSEELIAKGKREADEYYLPKLNELSTSNEQLISSNEQLISSNEQLISFNDSLSSRINYLQELLNKNNISFN